MCAAHRSRIGHQVGFQQVPVASGDGSSAQAIRVAATGPNRLSESKGQDPSGLPRRNKQAGATGCQGGVNIRLSWRGKHQSTLSQQPSHIRACNKTVGWGRWWIGSSPDACSCTSPNYRARLLTGSWKRQHALQAHFEGPQQTVSTLRPAGGGGPKQTVSTLRSAWGGGVPNRPSAPLDPLGCVWGVPTDRQHAQTRWGGRGGSDSASEHFMCQKSLFLPPG